MPARCGIILIIQWRRFALVTWGLDITSLFGVAVLTNRTWGWAREDTDFVLHAARRGLQIRNGRCGCNMFHLYHGGDKGREPE